MSSRITTISLDDHTHAIKTKMGGNFSKFVRECLRRYEAHHSEAQCLVEKKIAAGLVKDTLVGGLCIPLGANYCNKHWPHGRPTVENWRTYREMLDCLNDPRYAPKLLEYWPVLEDFASPQEWVQTSAKLQNMNLFSIEDIDLKGNKKKEPTKKKRKSFISKMLNFL